MSRLRLVGPDRLPTIGAAILLAAIAWLPPALLALLDFFQFEDQSAISYFRDHTTLIRGLLVIPVLVVMERTADLRLGPVIDQFTRARLIAEDSMGEFRSLLKRADDRTSSWIAELVLIVGIMAIAVFGASIDIQMGGFDWDGRIAGDDVVLSRAGWWAHWISKPLFQFLVFRWFWRFGTWGWLLFRVSRLDLKLVAFHPDRSGGLGFLSVYPSVFSGLIFALACLAASTLIAEAQAIDMAVDTQRAVILGWLVLVFFVFVGPLAVMAQPLDRLREKAIFDLGRIASEHHGSFRDKWVESERPGEELLGSDEVSSASDLAPIAEAPYNIRIIPINLAVAVQLIVTAGSPMLVVIATQMPLQDFMSYIVSTIF